MSETIKRPKRKNPILKTRAPTLPPDRRSRIALGLVRGAALGKLELQCCAACGAVQYPPREACVRCLSPELEWTAIACTKAQALVLLISTCSRPMTIIP